MLPIMGRIGSRTERPNAIVFPSIGRTRLSPVWILLPSTPRSFRAMVHALRRHLDLTHLDQQGVAGFAPTTSIGPVTGIPGVYSSSS